MRVNSKRTYWMALIARLPLTVKHGAAVCLLALPLMFAPVPVGAWPQSLVGQPAPDFALRSLSQQTLRLSEFRGEVVLISFWASWCGSCRQAMPAFNAMYEKYNRAGLVMLSINMDDELHRAQHMTESLNIPFPVLYDERKEVGKLYLLDQMPLTVLVDRAGLVQQVFVGYHLGDERKFLTHVRELLNE
jgi:peroxiredoxin